MIATADVYLFDVKEFTRKRSRVDRRAEVAAMKKEHGIYTHLCRGGGDWLAMSMPECIKALQGYDLTKEEKEDGALLLAGYCRLLDEAGLVEQDHKTEWLAVQSVLKRMKAK